MNKKILLSAVLLSLTSCANSGASGDNSYPKTREEEQQEAMGKLTGEDGIVLFGGSKKSAATEGINVNSFLWRASLDMVHKMPLISADPFGGTIITDWYALDDNPSERYKINVYIIGPELRSDAIKVGAFKQTRNAKGVWSESLSHPALASELENKILLKAREIKFQKAR
jgi:hypothetical protein